MHRPCLVAMAALLTVMLASPSSRADTVLQTEPDAVEALVAQDHGDRLLVVHYTSDDGSCSYCLDSNAAVAPVAEALGDRFVFARVVVNPWRGYFDEGHPVGAYQNRIGYRMAGVPAAMVFLDGQPVRLITSIGPDFAAELEQIHQLMAGQAATAPGQVSVSRVAPDGIEEFVRKSGGERPIVITVSSTDAACSHCIEANAVVDDASRHLAESYTFVRIDFDPWQSFSTDAVLADFLAAHGAALNGLPTSYLVNDGRILGQMPTLRGNLRNILVQALPGLER